MTACLEMDSEGEILTVEALTKKYGDFYALNNVDFTVRQGSVHALLGHNGAGKSTLISIVSGAISPTSGRIFFEGEQAVLSGPRDAGALGISVIHQHLSLVDSLTVADNIFIGEELTKVGLVQKSEQLEEARRALARVGATCHPEDRVSSLPTAQRQLVEIAKALRRETKLLILDEPTAALSDKEARILGSLVMQLKNEGLGIVYVTHLLEEVERLADELTVLEDGQVSHKGLIKDLSRSDLVRLISGDRVSNTEGLDFPGEDRSSLGPKPNTLEIRDLGGDGFEGINITMAPQEVIGIFGMLGSGQTEFLETLAGARKPHSGQVLLDGSPLIANTPYKASRRGVHLVSADRSRNGLLPSMNVLDNMLISATQRLAWFGWRRRNKERALYERVTNIFQLRASSNMRIGTLSGGNQQKVMVSRAAFASHTPRLLLLDGPTQGVDVGARADIYESLRRLATVRNVAILFSSTDPEEMLDLADRIVILRNGKLVAEVPAVDVNDTQIIALASHGSSIEE